MRVSDERALLTEARFLESGGFALAPDATTTDCSSVLAGFTAVPGQRLERANSVAARSLPTHAHGPARSHTKPDSRMNTAAAQYVEIEGTGALVI